MKTTKQDFESFKLLCGKWIKQLGLTDWAVYYYHKKQEAAYAQTHWNMSSAAATIEFNTFWDEGRAFNQVELERLALHEVLHILMAQLVCEAEDRYSNQTAINIAEHSIIRRLENALL